MDLILTMVFFGGGGMGPFIPVELQPDGWTNACVPGSTATVQDGGVRRAQAYDQRKYE